MSFELFISTGFFAAIAASIFSVVMTLVNNKHIKRMESAKKDFELQKYRYQKLHEYLEQMNGLPQVTYALLTNEGRLKMFEKSNERFYKIKSISNAVIPILDGDLRILLKESFEKETEISKKLSTQMHAQKRYDGDVGPLVLARNASESELVSATQKQLERLLSS